jgi:hypothetical protein
MSDRFDCYPSGTVILGQLGVLGNLDAVAAAARLRLAAERRLISAFLEAQRTLTLERPVRDSRPICHKDKEADTQ